MATIPGPADDIASKYNDLLRRIENLETARPLEAATVGKGGITIANGGSVRVVAPNGAVIATIGALPASYNRIDGSPQQGVILTREDGTIAMVLADVSPTTNPIKQAFQIQDRSANIVIADDTNGGVGVARPYVPVATFEDISSATVPMTNSAAFADIQWGLASRQHPRVVAQMLVRSDLAGTTGNVRLMDGLGNQVGPTIAVAANTFVVATIGPVAWTGGTWSFTEGFPMMVVQAQRTAGTGNIGAKMLGCWGLQS